MANEPIEASSGRPTLGARQVYAMAALCLIVGLGIGYLVRGAQSPARPAGNAGPTGSPAASAGAATPAPVLPGVSRTAASQTTPSTGTPAATAAPGAMGAGHMPVSMEQMKQMADKQAGPLLEKLKADPNNAQLLLQIGAIYHTAHQYKIATGYYDKAKQVDPKDASIRIKLASNLYRDGDVNGALKELNEVLSRDPNNANALFDLGMIKLKGKGDSKGAVAAWQQLLKSNPQLPADRKAMVQKLLADVLTTMGEKPTTEGARP